MTPTDIAVFKVLIDKAIPKVVNGTDGGQGKAGQRGLTGGAGKQGLRGKQGLSGKDAVAAVNGSQGARGFIGKDGKRGKDGTKGKSGGLGKAGPKGKNGGQGLKGRDGGIGLSGDKGRGVASIKVNSEDMLVITYDDGDLDIAGKMHFSKTSSGGDYYTGAPLGTFGIRGTKTSPTGELIIIGPWGKEFNTGFISGGGITNDWITLTTSFSSIPTFNTALLGGSVYNYLYNNDTLTLFRYIAAGGSDRYFQTFNGTSLGGLVATKAQTITL